MHRRRRTFNALSAAGRVEEVLSLLEEVEDPHEAAQLAEKTRDNFQAFQHHAALARMEEAIGELGGSRKAPPERPWGQDMQGRIATLQVEVRRACGLPAKDGLTGSSDPFVVLEVTEPSANGGTHIAASARTEVKVMTLEPDWNETFVLPVNATNAVLRASVFDWDMDGSDDFIGQVSLPLAERVTSMQEQRSRLRASNAALAASIAGDLPLAYRSQQGMLGRTLGGASVDPHHRSRGRQAWNSSVRPILKSAGLHRLAEDPGLGLSAGVEAVQPQTVCLHLAARDGTLLVPRSGLELTVRMVPPEAGSVVASVEMLSRATLKRIDALVPQEQTHFTADEYLASKHAVDAQFYSSRSLTRDVLWPRDVPVADFDPVLVHRRSLAASSWQVLSDPTLPYRLGHRPPRVARPPDLPGECSGPASGATSTEQAESLSYDQNGRRAVRVLTHDLVTSVRLGRAVLACASSHWREAPPAHRDSSQGRVESNYAGTEKLGHGRYVDTRPESTVRREWTRTEVSTRHAETLGVTEEHAALAEEIERNLARAQCEEGMVDADARLLASDLTGGITQLERARIAAENARDAGLLSRVLGRLGDAYRSAGEFRLARDVHARHLGIGRAGWTADPTAIEVGADGGVAIHSALKRTTISDQGTRASGGWLSAHQLGHFSRREGVREKDLLRQLPMHTRQRLAAEKEERTAEREVPLGDEIAGDGGLREQEAEAAAHRARTYRSEEYWKARANARLERVNWSAGCTLVKAEHVRDAVKSFKQARTGEPPALYVRAEDWGKQRPVDGN